MITATPTLHGPASMPPSVRLEQATPFLWALRSGQASASTRERISISLISTILTSAAPVLVLRTSLSATSARLLSLSSGSRLMKMQEILPGHSAERMLASSSSRIMKANLSTGSMMLTVPEICQLITRHLTQEMSTSSTSAGTAFPSGRTLPASLDLAMIWGLP